MEKDNFSTIRNYCVENGYYVSVHKDENINGCTAIFPETNIYNACVSGCITFYELSDLGIEYYCSYHDGGTKMSRMECPDYSKRILVFHDILKKTFALGMSPKLVICYDEHNNTLKDEGFINCLNPPPEADEELENSFVDIFYRFLSDPDKDYSSLARMNNVEQGYNLLKLPFLKQDIE